MLVVAAQHLAAFVAEVFAEASFAVRQAVELVAALVAEHSAASFVDQALPAAVEAVVVWVVAEAPAAAASLLVPSRSWGQARSLVVIQLQVRFLHPYLANSKNDSYHFAALR